MASDAFASLDDLRLLWRTMTTAEEDRAAELLQVVSDRLRVEASTRGRDLDGMIAATPYLDTVAKSVTCDIVARTMMTSTSTEPLSQFSQSAGGYSVSGTFLNPGGGIFVKNKELAALGLLRQRIGGFDPYAPKCD